MMEYWDYIPSLRRIFYEYVVPRIADKNTDYILEFYPCSIDGSFGVSRFPKQVFIYVETIRQTLRGINISQYIEKDYVYMLATLTMLHEVLHLEQDIAMSLYDTNEAYMNDKEGEVEYRSLEILKMDAQMLEKQYGFVCNFMMLDFSFSTGYRVYHEADAKTWYWNTIINVVIKDYIGGPKMMKELQYDVLNDLYVDIAVSFIFASSTISQTCRIKANGEYLMSAIPEFASIVHGFCSRWTGYRVSVVSKEVLRGDGCKDLAIGFCISDQYIRPMIFKPRV